MEELKPCPICGGKVEGRLRGGYDRFGCDEFSAEVECRCGLTFDVPCVSEETWESELASAWNARSGEKCRDKDAILSAIKELEDFSMAVEYDYDGEVVWGIAQKLRSSIGEAAEK